MKEMDEIKIDEIKIDKINHTLGVVLYVANR